MKDSRATLLSVLTAAILLALGAPPAPAQVSDSANALDPAVASDSPEWEHREDAAEEVTINGEPLSLARVGESSRSEAAEAAPTRAVSALVARRFYLSNTTAAPNLALTTCAAGFHMASFWEIRDPSNLAYAFDHPSAKNKADSGQGPPSYWYGWVRTGYDASGSAVAGTGNCLNWTSSSNLDSAAAVRLSRTWETPPNEIGGDWDVTLFTCQTIAPVWCVED